MITSKYYSYTPWSGYSYNYLLFRWAEKNMLEAISGLEEHEILMFPVLKNLGKVYINNDR